jgi:hypothetical protein
MGQNFLIRLRTGKHVTLFTAQTYVYILDRSTRITFRQH